MEGKAAAEEVIFDVLGHIPIDALVRLHAEEIGRDFEHVGPVQERLVSQLEKPFSKDGLRRGDELPVALRCRGFHCAIWSRMTASSPL